MVDILAGKSAVLVGRSVTPHAIWWPFRKLTLVIFRPVCLLTSISLQWRLTSSNYFAPGFALHSPSSPLKITLCLRPQSLARDGFYLIQISSGIFINPSYLDIIIYFYLVLTLNNIVVNYVVSLPKNSFKGD